MIKEGGRLSGSVIVGVVSIPIVGAMLNGLYNGPLYRITPAFFWAADIALFVLAPAVILYWLAKTERILPRNYGLAFPSGGVFEAVAGSVFFSVILAAAYEVSKYIGWIFTWRWYVPPDFSYSAVTPDGFSGLLVAGYWAVTAGLVESVFYIGLPWCLWRHRFGLEHRRTLFLMMSTALFALIHWEQGLHGVIAAFVFGLAACVLYWKINDLWPIVGAHAV
ncbi:MAG: CPBP family intramembrane metalloprotease [Betaproteobacteria bacterium]|nr:CPBP family intramembrane metalloprotease [Betaproteobacteria bacterium]